VCPSGQRERAVNPSAQPTEVRILPPPLTHAVPHRSLTCDYAHVSARLSPARPADASNQRGFTLFVPLVVPFAILAGVAAFAVVSPNNQRTTPPSRPGALVWGDGIFANKTELQAWLRLHTGSYRRWARQHPAALRLVDGHPVRSASRRKSATAAPAPARGKARASSSHATNASAVAAAARPASIGRSTAQPLGTILFVAVLGLLALGAALVPRQVIEGVAPSWSVADSRRVGELRVALCGAGFAMLCGIGLALFLN
jgi:hypothetical protein